MAWKETGFSPWWSSVSSSEGAFGAVWEEQLGGAQHPGIWALLPGRVLAGCTPGSLQAARPPPTLDLPLQGWASQTNPFLS